MRYYFNTTSTVIMYTSTHFFGRYVSNKSDLPIS